MVSRTTRIVILALVAAAVVALSGFPAQAQPYYYNNYYGPQPYTYYNNGPYYSPYYTYYYYGPSRSAGSHER